MRGCQILKEGEFDQKWLPALTAGVHYKYNDGISEVNNEVGGALARAMASRMIRHGLHALRLQTVHPTATAGAA